MMVVEEGDEDWDMPTAVVVVDEGEVCFDWVADGRDAFGILNEGGSH
jgi:hypothetical protein